MRRTRFKIVTLILAVTLALSASACSSSEAGIVGSWADELGIVLTFTDDGLYFEDLSAIQGTADDFILKGTYSIDGNTVITKITEMRGEPLPESEVIAELMTLTREFIVAGNQLTLLSDDEWHEPEHVLKRK